jgi:hypothetical protein
MAEPGRSGVGTEVRAGKVVVSPTVVDRRPSPGARPEDLVPHTLIFDAPEGHLEAFLRDEPGWANCGIWRFRDRAVAWAVYVLSEPADRAYTRWSRSRGR